MLRSSSVSEKDPNILRPAKDWKKDKPFALEKKILDKEEEKEEQKKQKGIKVKTVILEDGTYGTKVIEDED